jgi:methyl-accepting chemotaxis protein
VAQGKGNAAENTAAVVEEMLTSIEQVADNASQSLEVSLQGNQLCGDGRKVAQDASREMAEIAVAVSHSAELIADLSRKSGEINQIVLLIKDVAGNTNLLALNAAIGQRAPAAGARLRRGGAQTSEAPSTRKDRSHDLRHPGGAHQAVAAMDDNPSLDGH